MIRRRKAPDQPTRTAKAASSKASDTTLVYDPKKSKLRKRHRWLKRSAIGFVVLMVAVGGAFVAHSFFSLNHVIQRNTGVAAAGLKGPISLAQLKGEGDGRINILALGVGDSGHAGAQLSDTIMVISIDPRTNDIAMLGIPRDLWVSIPGYGYSKINAANAYGEQNKTGGGPDLVKKVVSTTLGIPIHYFVRVDFSAFKQAVNTVGGVDVTVKQALYDSEYPCEKNEAYSCGFSLKAGPQHLDGTVALKYVRCRKGSCGDDFGRAQRQQQVLTSLRTKALTMDTLLNPAKLVGLIDTVGDNVRTDLQLNEITRLVDIVKKIDTTKIVNAVLDNSADGTNLVRTANIGGASVVVPSAGVGQYSAIQNFVRSIFVDGYIKQEQAKIEVQNGTPTIGLALNAANLLKSYNYNVIGSMQADATTYKTTKIIDHTGGTKPYTLKYLENRFGVKPEAAAATTPAATGEDITIIIGSDYKATQL